MGPTCCFREQPFNDMHMNRCARREDGTASYSWLVSKCCMAVNARHVTCAFLQPLG